MWWALGYVWQYAEPLLSIAAGAVKVVSVASFAWRMLHKKRETAGVVTR